MREEISVRLIQAESANDWSFIEVFRYFYEITHEPHFSRRGKTRPGPPPIPPPVHTPHTTTDYTTVFIYILYHIISQGPMTETISRIPALYLIPGIIYTLI